MSKCQKCGRELQPYQIYHWDMILFCLCEKCYADIRESRQPR